jgi:hypothetical protein
MKPGWCGRLSLLMTEKQINLWPFLPFAVLFFFVAIAQFMPEADANPAEDLRQNSSLFTSSR